MAREKRTRGMIAEAVLTVLEKSDSLVPTPMAAGCQGCSENDLTCSM